MNRLDIFVDKTSKGFLIIAGLVTCGAIFLAINLSWTAGALFSGLLDYTPASIPGLRHWGIMVFGIGVMLVVSAFRPQIRFETMLFSLIEKAFMAYLYLYYVDEPWANAYLAEFIVDSTIVAYSLLYFISRHGRPHEWKIAESKPT